MKNKSSSKKFPSKPSKPVKAGAKKKEPAPKKGSGGPEPRGAELTVTFRLTRDDRNKINQAAEDSGVSAKAILTQLIRNYVGKLDLGQRLDTLEEKVAQIEHGQAISMPPSVPLSTLGLSVKIAEHHERFDDIHIQRDLGGGYSATALIGKAGDVEGNEPADEVASQGETLLDAVRNFNEAIDLHFTDEDTPSAASDAEDAQLVDETEPENEGSDRADNASGSQNGDENDR